MIPIYRAKKIDSDEYVEGFLYQDIIGYKAPSEENPKDRYYRELDKNTWFIMDNKSHTNMIDKSTLSISFDNMLDSEGSKIFASLQEDGKGGDMLICDNEREYYVAEFTKYGLAFYEYLDNDTIKNSISFKACFPSFLKITGIKQ